MNDASSVLPGVDGPAGAAPSLTHADWFSGIGGFALAFERAGFRTVSFSEIEPFPLRVLGTHWPDVPQLGDILRVAGADVVSAHATRFEDGDADPRGAEPADPDEEPASSAADDAGGEAGGREGPAAGRGAQPDGGAGEQPGAVPADWGDPGVADDAWKRALVWTGGTPCQDFSIAGRRGGLFNSDGSLSRSGLALIWLDLIERHKPRWIVWENVPGILSSNQGRDMAALLRALEQLGYGWAFRTLDAQEFGVPQRRRRVFTVAALGDPLAIGPRAVLALDEGEGGDLGSGSSAGEEPPAGARGGPVIGFDVAGPLTKRYAKGINTTIDDGAVVVQRAEADPSGVREAPGVPGRVDHPALTGGGEDVPAGYRVVSDEGVHPTVHGRLNRLPSVLVSPETSGPLLSANGDAGYRQEPGEGIVAFRKSRRAQNPTDDETWVPAEAANTLNQFDDTGDVRATHLVYQQQGSKVGPMGVVHGHNHTNGVGFTLADGFGPEDDLLPKGMDSNRYKALGNAVAVPVVEWIARRLRAYIEEHP